LTNEVSEGLASVARESGEELATIGEAVTGTSLAAAKGGGTNAVLTSSTPATIWWTIVLLNAWLAGYPDPRPED
jgi:hypothetical protein